jgi:hypothetical protein
MIGAMDLLASAACFMASAPGNNLSELQVFANEASNAADRLPCFG